MPFDFPNSPTTGQLVTASGGQQWIWDGVKWTVVSGTSPGFAPINSPVFTGDPQAPTPPASDADTSVATTAFVQAATATALHNVGRNLVHNPLFNVAQRGRGPWSANGYTLDRWLLNYNLDGVNQICAAAGDADRSAIGDEAAIWAIQTGFTGNAGASAYSYIEHRIEGVRRLAGKTVTVSFWADSAPTLKLGVNMFQVFGSGGSPSSAVTVQATGQAVTVNATWQRFIATFTIPSAAGKTFGTNGDDYTILRFYFSSGATGNAAAGNIGVQTGTVNLWGVQLEVGSVATPLEKPDPRYDLANCRRFYQRGFISIVNYAAAAGAVTAYFQPFPAVFRIVPTITPTYTVQTNGAGQIGTIDSGGFQPIMNGTAIGTVNLAGTYSASADL